MEIDPQSKRTNKKGNTNEEERGIMRISKIPKKTNQKNNKNNNKKKKKNNKKNHSN